MGIPIAFRICASSRVPMPCRSVPAVAQWNSDGSSTTIDARLVLPKARPAATPFALAGIATEGARRHTEFGRQSASTAQLAHLVLILAARGAERWPVLQRPQGAS